MRIPFVVYALVYLLIELIGARLDAVGWPQLTPLDVATAVTDALLVVAVLIAALVALDLGARRWRLSMALWAEEQARLTDEREDGPIGVPSWRPEPLALPAGPSATPPTGTYDRPRYSGNPYAGDRFPEEPAHLL